jgi:trans-2,3-dihydro-3-hydroxyanthranilate isomerase
MRSLRYVICDVFTDRPLTGNQLAVFTDARGLSTETMQSLAREMNYSESTFVFPAEQGGTARIRIFTPRHEVPFAGHPTLGTAFVLGGTVPLPEIALETGRGIVPVRLERNGVEPRFGWMDQPLPTITRFEPVAELLRALGVERAELPVEVYDNGIAHVFVMIGSREAVAAVRPDLARLESLAALGFNVFSGEGGSWKTRMFAPGGGVSEDPATGSAAGPLALHLARHGRIPFGEVIRIEQGAEIQRPSLLFARAHGSVERVDRVEVGGSAVVIGRGELRLPV